MMGKRQGEHQGVFQPRFSTVLDGLEAHISRSSDKVALTVFETDYTFREVGDHASAISAWLTQRGVKHGDRVLIQLQNVPQFAFAAIGTWRLGATVVPVNPMYRAREIHRIASDSGAKVWVTTPSIWAGQGATTVPETNLEHVVLTEVEEFAAGVPEEFCGADSAGETPNALPVTRLADIVGNKSREATLSEPATVDDSDVALLTYTSGTTGPPKGARTTHGNLAYVGAGYPAFNGVRGPDHVVLATAPLVHITGLAMHLASWLMEGSQIVLAYRFHPRVHLDQLEKTEATWTTGTATAYTALIQEMLKKPRNVSSLQFVGCGGSAVPTDFARRFKDVFGLEVGPGYGLTETTGAHVSTPPGEIRIDEESGIISVGVPVFDGEVRIIGNDGTDLGTRERGEILASGPNVVDGFWDREHETTAQFLDGWVKTGDVGFVDEDGWLYIVDRTKNLIVASGFKIWPREVEDVLYSHPGVQEVAVVGAPDEYRGETVVAFISASTTTSEAFRDELKALCREQLAAYKIPGRIVFRDELPKNFNGKIRVRDLRKEAAEVDQ
ncbi:class I adenylate-forming enzyme family protein [Ancrocorticia sp.]|uniref:class I adenylate-forming enzyme family protein n=1 Tax=Ancrocorticia sp. TaxID=2593684 RepID=UPI003F92E953